VFPSAERHLPDHIVIFLQTIISFAIKLILLSWNSVWFLLNDFSKNDFVQSRSGVRKILLWLVCMWVYIAFIWCLWYAVSTEHSIMAVRQRVMCFSGSLPIVVIICDCFSHYFQKINLLLTTMIEGFSESFRFRFSLQIDLPFLSILHLNYRLHLFGLLLLWTLFSIVSF